MKSERTKTKADPKRLLLDRNDLDFRKSESNGEREREGKRERVYPKRVSLSHSLTRVRLS